MRLGLSLYIYIENTCKMPPYPMATIRFVANVNTRFSARSPFSFARTRSSALRKKHLLPENFVQIQHRIYIKIIK